MNKNMLFLMLTMLLCSCDRVLRADGRVVEEATGKVLRGVRFREKNSEYTDVFQEVDSMGRFHFYEIRSGGDKRNAVLLFVKDSFMLTEQSIAPGDSNVVIKMKRWE